MSPLLPEASLSCSTAVAGLSTCMFSLDMLDGDQIVQKVLQCRECRRCRVHELQMRRRNLTKHSLLIAGPTYCHGFLFLAGTNVLANGFPLPQFADCREA